MYSHLLRMAACNWNGVRYCRVERYNGVEHRESKFCAHAWCGIRAERAQR